MEDAVRPGRPAVRSMYERGYRTWTALSEAARTEKRAVTECLNSLPFAFPNHPHFPQKLAVDLQPSNTILVKGKTTWAAGPEPQDLPTFRDEVIFQVASIQPTTIVMMSEMSLSEGILPGLFAANESNHVPVLMLAWAYILSARWAELIPGAGVHCDKQNIAIDSAKDTKQHKGGQSPIVVDIGDVSLDAMRWWHTILSTECRWHATVCNAKNVVLYSPWSTSIKTTRPFTISSGKQQHSDQYAAETSPPSFNTALRYLSEYCNLHSLTEQSQAAFAAALFIPVAKFEGRDIEMAFPQCLPIRSSQKKSASKASTWAEAQIGRLLTLSCNPRGAKALLGSIFFEPEVDSNLCGAWLQGSFAVLSKIQDPNLLVRTLIQRDPDLGILWLGAFLTGGHTRCLREARAAWSKVDLNAAAWTDTHASFIQQPMSKESLDPDAHEISRADECRLLCLSHGMNYPMPPLLPFAPFGSTSLNDVEIEVRKHSRCGRHHSLSYQGFTWDCEDGIKVHQGRANESSSVRMKIPSPRNEIVDVDYDDLDSEDDSSEMVTRNIFTRLRGESGFPVAERAIREHEWIENLDSDDDTPIEGDVRSSAGGGAFTGGC